MRRVRTTAAAVGAALLLLSGCDQAEQVEPAEEPAGQAEPTSEGGDQDEGDAPVEEDTSSGESTEDEAADGPDDDTAKDSDNDDAAASDSGSDSEDPCADLTADDVGDVLGVTVGDREESVDAAPDVDAPQPENLVVCTYPASDPESLSATLYWLSSPDDLPDEMPDDIQEEHAERMAQSSAAAETTEGEEVDVEGAEVASVRVTEDLGVVLVTVYAAHGPDVLHSYVVGQVGTLDESDIPLAVELAELAIAKAS